MRGALRLAECFALGKHSSEDFYRRGQNFFPTCYLTDIGQNTLLTNDFCEHTWRTGKKN